MAGLPENSQYQTGGIPSSAGAISKNLGINFSQPGLIKQSTQALQDQMAGVEPGVAGGILPKTGNGILDFITSGRSFASGAPMSGATMDQGYDLFSQGAYNVEGPLATYDGSRMPIPEDYQWRDQAPSDQAYILNFQNGGGQMVVDPNNRGAIFKSARDEMGGSTAGSIDRQMSLGSRSSGLFQIDHIIPLWLGGADTDYNKETISTAKHARKTKVQAVPYTLLRKGLITADEARTWAMNWQDLDYKDIPAPSEESGMLGEVPVQFAKDKLAVWKKHKAEGFYPNNKTPGLFATMHDPEFAKTLGEDIIPGDGVVADTLQEIYKGAASALTLGWVPYVPDDDANGAQKMLGIIANAGVSMIPVLALGRLATGAQLATRSASILNKMKLAGWLGKSAQTAAQAAATAQKAGTVAKTAETATTGIGGLLNVARPFYNAASTKASKAKDLMLKFSFMKNDPAALKMMKEVGIGSIAYGQLGPQGVVGAMAGEEGAEPFERFAEDFIYSGVALFAKPGMRGLVPTMATPIALGMTIDGLSGEELNTKEWITTSLLMGGLHLYGSPAMRKRADFVTKELEKGLTVNAHTKVSSFVSEESLPKLVEGKPIPKPEGVDENGFLSIAEAEQKEAQLWNEARESVIKMRDGGGIDEASMMMELTDIKRSLHQLKKSWLSDTDRRALDIEDIEFTLDSIKNGRPVLSNTEPGRSSAMHRLKGLLSKDDLTLEQDNTIWPSLKKDEIPDYKSYGLSKEGNAVGRGQLTGPGVKSDQGGLLGVLGKNAEEYINAVREGNASRTLIAVERSELTPVMKEINATYSLKDIENKLKRPMQNPQNTLEVYGAFYDAQGNIFFKVLGYAPRKFAISEKALALNSNPRRPSKLDPEYNKDTLVEEMRRKGLKFLTLTFNEAESGLTRSALNPDVPFINFDVTDANWSLAQRINEKYLSRVRDEEGSAAAIAELIMEAKNATGKARQTFVDKINKVLRDDNLAADDVLRKASEGTASSKSSEAMTAYLYDVRRALETGADPASVAANFKETLTIDLTPDEARALFLQKNELSVAQVLKITDTAIKEGRMGDKALIYEGFVKPFMASSDFVRWGMRHVFDDLKIIGDPSVARNMSKLGGVEKIPGEFDAIDTTTPKAPIQEVPPVAAPVSPAQPAPMSKNVLDLTGASSLVSIPQKKSSKLAAALTNHAVKSPMIQRKPEVPVEMPKAQETLTPPEAAMEAPIVKEAPEAPAAGPTGVISSRPIGSIDEKARIREAEIEARKPGPLELVSSKPNLPTSKQAELEISKRDALERKGKATNNRAVTEYQETQTSLANQSLEEVVFTERSGDESYMSRLAATAEKNIPDYSKLPREFSYAEKQEVLGNLKYRIRQKAWQIFEDKVPAKSRLNFSKQENIIGSAPTRDIKKRTTEGLPTTDPFGAEDMAVVDMQKALDRDFFKVPVELDPAGKPINLSNLEAYKMVVGDDFYEKAGKRMLRNTEAAQRESLARRLGLNKKTPSGSKNKNKKVPERSFEYEQPRLRKVSEENPITDEESLAARKIFKDFFDDNLKKEEGDYFRVIADDMVENFEASLGKDWRDDEDLIRIFGASVDPKTGRYPEGSVFSSLFKPKEFGSTQPDDVIRYRGEGRYRKAREAYAKRNDENIEQQITRADLRSQERGPMDEGNDLRDLPEDAMDAGMADEGNGSLLVEGDLGEGMSADDFSRVSLTSENQSDATNFPEDSMFETIFPAFTNYMRKMGRGEEATLTPADAAIDATRFLQEVNRSLKGITGGEKKLLIEHADTRNAVSAILWKLRGKADITDKSLTEIKKEGIELTQSIDKNEKKALDVLVKELIPGYTNIQMLTNSINRSLSKKGRVDKKGKRVKPTYYPVPSKIDIDEARRDIVRYTRNLQKRVRLGENADNPPREDEVAFYNLFEKYKDLQEAIHEDKLRRSILRLDYPGKKKNLSAGEISRLIEKRPKPPEFY